LLQLYIWKMYQKLRLIMCQRLRPLVGLKESKDRILLMIAKVCNTKSSHGGWFHLI
jgi:hypothetical protein